MIKKSIQSKRGRVYYWINETKSPITILFCHGLTADHTLFDKQLTFWSEKSNILTWDIPLHGESRPYKNFTYSNVVDDLKLILNQENINNIILVGQSAGGYISQAFISKYTNKVKAFIGIGTTPFGEYYYKNWEIFLLKHFTQLAKIYPYSFYCKISSKKATFTTDAYKNFFNALNKLGKANMLKSAKAMYKGFVDERKDVKFMCPVLLTYGDHDNVGYVKKYNQLWSKHKNFPLEIIPNASHNANYDNYYEFNNIVFKFLKKHELI
jgi:pimeloyl-ACP methyl ester carboxylesterase